MSRAQLAAAEKGLRLQREFMAERGNTLAGYLAFYFSLATPAQLAAYAEHYGMPYEQHISEIWHADRDALSRAEAMVAMLSGKERPACQVIPQPTKY